MVELSGLNPDRNPLTDVSDLPELTTLIPRGKELRGWHCPTCEIGEHGYAAPNCWVCGEKMNGGYVTILEDIAWTKGRASE